MKKTKAFIAFGALCSVLLFGVFHANGGTHHQEAMHGELPLLVIE